jgi:hypothetical protein
VTAVAAGAALHAQDWPVPAALQMSPAACQPVADCAVEQLLLAASASADSVAVPD